MGSQYSKSNKHHNAKAPKTKLEVRVEPLCIERGSTAIIGKKRIVLRRFQEDVLDYFLNKKARPFLFLSAPTGSGKTFSLLIPFIASFAGGVKYEGAVGVYPTKALVNDQRSSLENLLKMLSRRYRETREGVTIFDVDSIIERGGSQKRMAGKVALATLTREVLEEILGRTGAGSKRTVLELMKDVLIGEAVDYVIALAVPEYPYMILSHMYRSYSDTSKLLQMVSNGGCVYELVKSLCEESDRDKVYATALNLMRQLRRIGITRTELREMNDLLAIMFSDTLFMDEFHVWGLYEKPTAVAMILMYFAVGFLQGKNPRVVLSSATPDQEVVSLLRKIFASDVVETVIAPPDDCARPGTEKIRGETILIFETVPTTVAGPVGWLMADSHLPEVVRKHVEELRHTDRFIVLGRRVSTLESAADIFYEETGRMPILVTGVAHPVYLGKDELARRTKLGSGEDAELPLFGNYSVELGIDFVNVNYAIITSSSVEELVQRMGRVGRHGADSKVVVVASQYVWVNLAEKLEGREAISYKELVEDLLPSILPRTHILKSLSMVNTPIGKLRIYMPLALLATVSVAAYYDKVNTPFVQEFGKFFVEVVERLGLYKVFSWLAKKVSKNPDVLLAITAFRLAPGIRYRRGDRSDTASISTVLANYVVRLEGDQVILERATRLPVSKVFRMVLRADPATPPRSKLNGTILPASNVLRILRPERSVLSVLLETSNRPVLTVVLGSNRLPVLYELLNAYGYAVRLEFAGETKGYILLL